MEAYTEFARVYDQFMDDVPYEAWRDFLVQILHQAGILDGLVCELGCGTGRMTRMLAESGYDMIGIDASEEMLSIAREHESGNNVRYFECSGIAGGYECSSTAEEYGCSILYLLQDMREFELYGTVRAVVSVCDSMNYLLEEEDLLRVFRLANNYLDPGGILLFDLNTVYKFKERMGEQTFCEHHKDSSLIWDNYYDEDEKINEYELTLFIHEKEGLYRKYQETHYERGYELNEVIHLLEQSGMEYIMACDADDHGPVREDSERIYVMARERGKKADLTKPNNVEYGSEA